MTEERKQKLGQLLGKAMGNLEIRRSGVEPSLLPVEVYRTLLQRRWTFYSEDSASVLDFNPYITNEVRKSKLLDFIREEFAPFIHEDRIQSTTVWILGNFDIRYPLDALLEQLLKIAIGRGIEEAVSVFDRCTEDTFGSYQDVALLQGITLEAEIQVFEGIRLVPLPHSTSDLPHYLANLSFSPTGMSKYSLLGATLLIIDRSISPIFHKPVPMEITVQEYFDQVRLMFQTKVNNEDFPTFEKEDFYENFCQALSFACNYPVQIALKWSFLAEDELFNLTKREIGWMTQGDGSKSFRSSTEAEKTQIDEAKRLYNILFKPDSKVWEKLRIPVDRWVRSKIDKDPVDKIIDLGIALEALYLSDIGETTELSFRLRVHAAWHLGEDKEDRKALMKEFQEIYAWRSSVAHTGKLPKKREGKKKRRPYTEEQVAVFIERAQDLCRQSIIKVLEDRQFPNWNDLILGGEVENDAVGLDENPGGLG